MTGSRRDAGTLGFPAPENPTHVVALIALLLPLAVALAWLPGTVRAGDDRSGTATVEIHDYQCSSTPDRDLDSTIRRPADNGCWPLASTAFTAGHGYDARTGVWMWNTRAMGGGSPPSPARFEVQHGEIYINEWILPGVFTTPRVFCRLQDGDYTEYSVSVGNTKGDRLATINTSLSSGNRLTCSWLHLADDVFELTPIPQVTTVPLDPDVDIPRVDEEPRYPLPTLTPLEPTMPTLNTPVDVEPSYPVPTLVPSQPTLPAVETPIPVPATIPVIDVPVNVGPNVPLLPTPGLMPPVQLPPTEEPLI